MSVLVTAAAFPAYAVPAGTVITNVASASYLSNATPVAVLSNAASVTTQALAAPAASVVFDSVSGTPVDGAVVRLMNKTTGLPANVLGDDGVSVFPNTITSGSTVSDTGGTVYSFGSGQYRFPIVAADDYYLEVTPPGGYAFPTGATDAQLQSIAGAPWSLDTAGSRGRTFTVTGTTFDIDIPLDPQDLVLQMTANKSVVGKGEFIQYTLTLDNSNNVMDMTNVSLLDILPKGFRYVEGSTRIDGKKIDDPDIASDGKTLAWIIDRIKAGDRIEIRFVAQVAAGARTGQATNKATVKFAGFGTSATAEYTVTVTEELFIEKNILAGKVSLDSCNPTEGVVAKGIKDVRLYLEDGTYVQTDENGNWHIEGVNPGTHVVQLDTVSLPDEYEVVMCHDNTAHAGTPFSQFVDLKAGTLWRVDFNVALKKPRTAVIQQQVAVTPSGQDSAQVSIKLTGGEVPVSKLKNMVSLPDGWKIREGSIAVDGKPSEDAKLVNAALVVSLADKTGNSWAHDIRFDLDRTAGSAPAELKVTGMFATNVEPKGRLPMIKVPLEGGKPAQQASEVAVTAKWDKTASSENANLKEQRQEESDKFENGWLATANDEIELLYPSESYNPSIPAIRVGVKHKPKQKVSLKINGRPVSPLNYFGMIKNASATVAISKWKGVDITESENTLEVTVTDESGAVLKQMERKIHYSGLPASAELIPEKSVLVADGKNTPVIAVRFRDAKGYPARYGVLGTYAINAPYKGKDMKDDKAAEALINRDNDNKPKFDIRNDGIAYIALQPTSESGEAVLTFTFKETTEDIRVWLTPAQREWILVGLAEDSISQHMTSGDKGDALDASSVTDGRAAFFAKGTIKGEWLLTAAYDSSKESNSDDEEREERFKQVIDPDEYYTVYGDNSEQQYDAASSKKLYIKLAKDRFYAMFGDFESGLTVTELGQYSRSMTGYKTEYQGDKWSVNAFIAESEGAYQRDEIRGDGTSGLYQLSTDKIIPNTEKITIEVRDKFRSEKILSSESKVQNLDYSIDYDRGKIWFRAPVPVHDEDLNPVYIVVEYESEVVGENGYTAGGRVAYRPDELTEIGVTAITEDNVEDSGELQTIDVTRQLTDNLEIHLEAGQSDKTEDQIESRDNAYLAEMTYATEKSETSVYMRDIGEFYGLGQQSGSETGMRKGGVESIIDLTENTILTSEAFHQLNTDTGSNRSLAESRLEYLQDNWSVYSGLRRAEDDIDGDRFSASQLLLGGTLSPENSKFRFFNNTDILLNAESTDSEDNNDDGDKDSNQISDFPNRTALGVEYELTEKIDLIAQQEYSWGDYKNTETTMAGIRNKPWEGAETVSTLQQEYAPDGSDRLFSTMGLLQNFTWGDGWRSDFSLDRSNTLEGERSESTSPGEDEFESPPINDLVPAAIGSEDGEDYFAVSAGLGYVAELYEWTSRVEFRDAESEEKRNADFGFHHDIANGVSQTLGVLYTHELMLDTEEMLDTVDVRMTTGWRKPDSDWIVLQRLDLIFEETNEEGFNTLSRKVVQNTNADYKPDFWNQISLQYSSKYVLETFDDDNYSGYTDYAGMEYRRFLDKEWDVGVQAGTLHNWDVNNWQTTAGISVGYTPVKNTWVSVGYNFVGFRDDDFINSDYTDEGFYVKFRIKFDQQSLRDIVKKF